MISKADTYYARNKAKILARCKERYRQDPDMFIARVRRYQSNNPKRRNHAHKTFEKRLRQRLGDDYIKLVLSKGTNLPMTSWPDSLVQLKRAELQLKRHLKAYGKTEKH